MGGLSLTFSYPEFDGMGEVVGSLGMDAYRIVSMIEVPGDASEDSFRSFLFMILEALEDGLDSTISVESVSLNDTEWSSTIELRKSHEH